MFFYNVSDFGRVCTKCKNKYSVTNGTIFKNVKFGLLKAFRIVIKEHNNSFTSSSVEVSNEFKITQKTAWNFLNKIRGKQGYVIDLVEFLNNSNENKKKQIEKSSKPTKRDYDKVLKYLEKMDKLRHDSS